MVDLGIARARFRRSGSGGLVIAAARTLCDGGGKALGVRDPVRPAERALAARHADNEAGVLDCFPVSVVERAPIGPRKFAEGGVASRFGFLVCHNTGLFF